MSRIIPACLCFLLLLTNALAASLPASHTDITPALSIRRHLLQARVQTVNLTAYYVQACGENFVDCGNQRCCRGGQECLVGTQSGDRLCRDLSGTTTPTPSPTPPPSSGSKAPIGAIVGGVIGGVAVVAILCAICLYHRRRNTRTPAIPQAPIPNLPNVIEAKYPPPNETSYSGDNWLPGSFLYHNRNRSISTASASCVSPDGYTPGYDNPTKRDPNPEAPNIMELPGGTPTVELQGDDGYFVLKPQPPPPPPISPATAVSPTSLSRGMSLRSPAEFKQYWRKSRGN
ncbi:hypothetical protein H072_5917 [Dactylellina haptotyla CBS 200.50]|uniref:Uncharacterized protein n=1 Tax=Dactylellina haptotyla (strain CBS 200.50) TaxID=1284197 RepID=S8ABF0_DACHA|nr:hypothetical protein H072_5917 [Dactylellina haptotyla CBS 200.50]